MTIQIYKTRGQITGSVLGATLVAEIEVESHELPYNLNHLARRHGGDFAEIVHDYPILEELQPA